ncbi:MAG: AraC family transcriptional regulator [Eubacteriales bacterium]|nr:AraC family transcriptional regulator [Eubacteriales bacterium]
MQNHTEFHQLFPGISLTFLTLHSDKQPHRHESSSRILEISYCHQGRIGWELAEGNHVYLGPGDYSVHARTSCADSVMTLPNSFYEGLMICVDLDALTGKDFVLLEGTGITGDLLLRKFCREDGVSLSLAGNAGSEAVFSGFYNQPEQFTPAIWRVKALELLFWLAGPSCSPKDQLSRYQGEQVDMIRAIHDELAGHLDQRITIEDLSRKYLVNPTTLKSMFRAVYGNSVAAHMKEHRMEQAAALLAGTSDSIADIARAVGYESQSKFTAAFKAACGLLPTEYRKQSASGLSSAPLECCCRGHR